MELTMRLTTKQILVAARKLISKKKNWMSGTGSDGCKSMHCASTAISQIAVGHGDAWAARLALQKAARLPQTRQLGIIWNWNDAPKRTHKQVLNAFDRAIRAQKA